MRYEIRAVKGSAAVAMLPVEAADANSAAADARRQGYTVLSVRRARGLPSWRPQPRFELLLFAQELHALLAAGLSITESLESLAEKDHSARSGQVIQRIIDQLRQGRSFSQALASEPAAFPAFFVATVQTSERTGALSDSLARFAGYQTQLDAVKKKVVSASIYPLILVGSGALVLIFLLAYVVPRFAGVLAESGMELSWSTQLLITWGELVERHGVLLLGVTSSAIVIAGWALAQARVRARLAALLWRIGTLGERLRVFQLGRFYRTLGMLVQGGLPIVQALSLASNVLPAQMRTRMDAARREISEGQPTSLALGRHGLATPVALRMLRVGERGGNMGEMLERIAAVLDGETARWIEWFTRLFEPLLMALVGLVIGTIVVLMYVPVFELAGAVR